MELREAISLLPASLPITDEFEAGNGSKKTWYRSQKEHLQGWLAGYNGPGAYNRKTYTGTARDFYQRFRCVAGLLWLAEALGEDPDVLRGAVADVRAAGSNLSSQCGAFRRKVPWTRIEELLAERDRIRREGRRWSLFGNRRGAAASDFRRDAPPAQ